MLLIDGDEVVMVVVVVVGIWVVLSSRVGVSKEGRGNVFLTMVVVGVVILLTDIFPRPPPKAGRRGRA